MTDGELEIEDLPLSGKPEFWWTFRVDLEHKRIVWLGVRAQNWSQARALLPEGKTVERAYRWRPAFKEALEIHTKEILDRWLSETPDR